jgi:hypothetical protein
MAGTSDDARLAARLPTAASAALDEFLSRRKQRVLTFAGYSATGYQDPAAMLAFAATVLDAHLPDSTIVNSGATPQGIGAVYPLARQRGFTTIGIVSSLARTERITPSPFVDEVFYIEDRVWGGLLPGSTQLSATSAAIVAHSQEFVAIGGGVIAAIELCAARAAGRAVQFMPADMNHQVALQRAARKGQPPPADFRGAAHAAWFAGA